MSYVTVEVEIDHGRIVPREPERLPEKGTGLLTFPCPSAPKLAAMSPLQALEALQRHLNLDQKKAEAWMALVREARR
ncbi:MAG: hypothetical protein HYY24_12660 [Verrucomicrobia bacterium]|nr:hypothetical protein [Verrucomicrobiota bacterium]